MIYYRVALREGQSARWRWKSTVLTSLHIVLGLLKMYGCMPKECLRVFVSSSPEHMDEMLSRANQGLLSTAFTVDQLWDRQCMSWFEIRRLEVELGSGGDHDSPYTFSMPTSTPQVLSLAKLRTQVERGELDP